MKALVLEEYHRLVYRDVPDPEVRPDDVLIQVKACGICGSDVHGLDGSTGRRIPPVIMGHEASGIVVAVGANVKAFTRGERVTFDSTVYCGVCFHCRRGEINLCDHRRVLGVSCGEYRQDGAMAEYIAVPQHILYRLPEKIGFEQAAVVEACAIACHAVERTPVSLNDTALVVGAGMIGLLVIQALRAAGCGRIIAVDVQQTKVGRAQQLGADIGLNSRATDVIAEIKRLTADRGADIAFEAVGIAPALQTAIAGLRKGGALTLIGNLSPTVDLALQSVVTRELTLYGSCGSRGEYPACLDLMARGTIDVDSLITAVAPLSEGAAWFKRLYAQEDGLFKVILVP
ncbi:MAG: galactitol-1-phosphate 5-dehydrogenase [Desulfobacterales bacterium]|nr:MAG: galactitol-1-phosphate 5-dehydrogenase [Desulfobacterales bacterium]